MVITAPRRHATDAAAACAIHRRDLSTGRLDRDTPIETSTPAAKSRVVYTCIYYRTPKLLTSPTLWLSLVNMSAREHANLFFGVCPRFGSDQQFDQAWQIRVVLCLWSDLDHCTVEEALKRCEQAGPPASINHRQQWPQCSPLLDSGRTLLD